MEFKADCYVISARHKPHGTRHMRPAAIAAQYALADLHAAGSLPQSPPDKIVTSDKLDRLVRKQLEGKLPRGELDQLDRKTILLVADDMGIKYRLSPRGRPPRRSRNSVEP
jgi:hypothetical protein